MPIDKWMEKTWPTHTHRNMMKPLKRRGPCCFTAVRADSEDTC